MRRSGGESVKLSEDRQILRGLWLDLARCFEQEARAIRASQSAVDEDDMNLLQTSGAAVHYYERERRRLKDEILRQCAIIGQNELMIAEHEAERARDARPTS
jgi:hypothetical protein